MTPTTQKLTLDTGDETAPLTPRSCNPAPPAHGHIKRLLAETYDAERGKYTLRPLAGQNEAEGGKL